MTEKEKQLRLELIQMTKKIMKVAKKLSKNKNNHEYADDLLDICEETGERVDRI